jgi:hypothetical protein
MPFDPVYQIYGLRVRSQLALPALSATEDGETDLAVHWGGARPSPTEPPPPAVTIDWHQTKRGWLLRYHTPKGKVLEFDFNRNATEVEIRGSNPEMTQGVAALMVGAGLAAALHLRGISALHASAVLVDGAAILVAGPAGAGKSTLTAALVGIGMPLLSEDLAVLTVGSDGIVVQSGYPRLRLCPDAAPVVGRTPAELPRVFGPHALDDKRWVEASALAGGFHAKPAPLRAIYLLAPRLPDRKFLTIVPLPPHRAGLALLEHRYGAGWLPLPRAQALAWCARIANVTPVRVVHAPPGLDRIRGTAEAIVADSRRSPTGAQV